MLERTFFVIILLFAGATASCKNEQTPAENADAALDAGNLHMQIDAAKPKLLQFEQNSKEAASQKKIINEVDTVRPPKTTKIEAVLPRPSFPAPLSGRMIDIPTGLFLRGSSPGDLLREQFAENDNIPTHMKAYKIDVLPYPNDPAQPFLTNVSKQEAATRCSNSGKRLCTELEWEFACRGLDNRRYPSGNSYSDADYPDSDTTMPASPFGVFAMGRILEWTDSHWGKDSDQVERVAVRGFAPGQLLAEKITPAKVGRRCAKRWHRQPETVEAVLGFRCCKGPVNKEECFIERPRPAHSIYKNMKPDKFAKVIKEIPELSMLKDNPHMFSDGDIRAVLARRSSDRKELARRGIHFTWKPIRWIPRQGMELWVAVGRSNRHSFVVALHETKDNEKYIHASSFVIWNQAIPLALAYREGHRDELYWAPCWGCRDGGTIAFDDEKNEIIITHKW